MACKHKKLMAAYGRGENNWISTLSIRGQMVYICEDCGEIVGKKIEVIQPTEKGDPTLAERTHDALLGEKNE